MTTSPIRSPPHKKLRGSAPLTRQHVSHKRQKPPRHAKPTSTKEKSYKPSTVGVVTQDEEQSSTSPESSPNIRRVTSTPPQLQRFFLKQVHMTKVMKQKSFKKQFSPDPKKIYKWIRELHDDSWPLPRSDESLYRTAYPDKRSILHPRVVEAKHHFNRTRAPNQPKVYEEGANL